MDGWWNGKDEKGVITHIKKERISDAMCNISQHAYSGIVPQIRPQLQPSITSPNYYSPPCNRMLYTLSYWKCYEIINKYYQGQFVFLHS